MIYSNLLVIAYYGIKMTLGKCEKQLKESDMQIKAAESTTDIINKYIAKDRNDKFLFDIMQIMCYISYNKYQKELKNIHSVITNLMTFLLELNKLNTRCVPLIRCFIPIQELMGPFLNFYNEVIYNTSVIIECNSKVCRGLHKDLTVVVQECIKDLHRASIYISKLIEIAAMIVDGSKYILTMIEFVFEKEFGSD